MDFLIIFLSYQDYSRHVFNLPKIYRLHGENIFVTNEKLSTPCKFHSLKSQLKNLAKFAENICLFIQFALKVVSEQLLMLSASNICAACAWLSGLNEFFLVRREKKARTRRKHSFESGQADQIGWFVVVAGRMRCQVNEQVKFVLKPNREK